MTKVIADISMSLDGFVTGPDASPELGLGRGGEPLHTWAMASDDPIDTQILREGTERSGAVVLGRKLFDIVDGPGGWSDEVGYGARHAATPPFFVVTHRVPEKVRLRLDFTFVTTGIEDVIARARAATTTNVVVMGGGDVIRQCVDAGLLDELRIHLAPVVLGGGTPLFAGCQWRQFTQREVLVSSTATHLTYVPVD